MTSVHKDVERKGEKKKENIYDLKNFIYIYMNLKNRGLRHRAILFKFQYKIQLSQKILIRAEAHTTAAKPLHNHYVTIFSNKMKVSIQ